MNDWIGSEKNDYTFDNAGNTTEWIISTWANNDWQGKKRYTYLFNQAGKPTETTEYNFDTNTLTWIGATQSTYIYNTNNQTLLAQTAVWNTETSSWLPTSKYEYEYDEYQNQTLDSYYTAYNPETGTWTGSYKKIYLYNESKKKLLDEQYTWKNGEWVGSSKTTTSYNSNNKTDQKITYTWKDGEWVNETRNIHVFNSRGLEIITNEYQWLNDEWTYRNRNERSYEDDDRLRTELVETYEENTLTSHSFNRYHYTCDIKYFTIRFLNYDGETLQELTLAYGETPEYTGQTPTQPATAEYEYTFTGWDKEIVAVTADANYTAQFESNLRVYSVRFLNYDRKVLEDDILAYGMMPEYSGDVPTREEDETYIYTFSGWSPELSMVVGDITYMAQFEATEKTPTGVIDTNADDNGQAYNLLGQPVDDNYNGIIIRNGKKELR